jgi:hypothetical protein
VRCYFGQEVIAIATQEIETVVQRLSADPEFRLRYSQDPDGALRSYLSPEQIQAIKTGDGHKLQQLGCGGQWDKLVATLCGPDPGP